LDNNPGILSSREKSNFTIKIVYNLKKSALANM